MDRPLVVFDTETANLHGPPHLLELAAVRVVDGEVESHFESLVLPQIEIHAETVDVHGITDEEVRDASPAGEVLTAFLDWLGDDWLVAHDARRDASVLAFEAARAELELPDRPVLDTLELSKRLIPETSDHKLDTLVEELELEGDERHRALADATHCWQLLEECLARFGERSEGRVTGPSLLAFCRRITTLSDAAPTAPHVPRRLRPLEAACRERSSVTLAYGAEGEPPVPLDVAPRLLFRMGQRNYVEAECVSSGVLKTYRLDRIRKVLGTR